MNDHEIRRRGSLLSTLFFEPLATVPRLRSEMETVHGIACSADLIRADLTWLQEMGLVRWNGEAAQITERGRDVVAGRAKFPGAV
ncbi:hypothetical protein [Azonexus sp. R2A61]|uniref:hypothetical protein n=1 Tax=Azonexus sp. R2A61 TaxID=2744443 RepID=UPI001F423FA5|nr:hypothetical protein [Azonexus sp. R2A61]